MSRRYQPDPQRVLDRHIPPGDLGPIKKSRATAKSKPRGEDNRKRVINAIENSVAPSGERNFPAR